MTNARPPVGSLNTLLRELVTEFALSNTLANTTTSLLRAMCHHDDSILLGSWLEETDHQDVEEQLQPNSAAGSGALEHDHTSVFIAENKVHVSVVQVTAESAVSAPPTGYKAPRPPSTGRGCDRLGYPPVWQGVPSCGVEASAAATLSL